jgi:putative oxidoreductase
MDRTLSYAAPLGRLLLGGFFALAGFNKIGGYAGIQGYMESFGVPGELLPVTIALELAGGLALIAGWHTRLVAGLLAGFTIIAGLIFHADSSDMMQMLLFQKNVAIAGGLLLLVAMGPGALAVDSRRPAAAPEAGRVTAPGA